MTEPRFAAGLAALLLLLGACGNDDDASDTTTTTTSQPEPVASCSAADLAAEAPPEPQPDLPDAVAETRAAIVEAAVACDYARLADLALSGEQPFTYSFGDEGDPASHWQRLEDGGEHPLRDLVELLNGAYGTRPVEGSTQYLWPEEYADPDSGYLGYRVGITADGDWIFFVAGD